MRVLRRRPITIAAGVAGLAIVAGVAIAVATGGESTADGPLVCPNDDKVAGHGFPNPANPPLHATPEEAVREGLKDLANLDVGSVEGTQDPTLFVAKGTDSAGVIATARVTDVGGQFHLDQYEVCGYPDFTPATGPPSARGDDDQSAGSRREVAA